MYVYTWRWSYRPKYMEFFSIVKYNKIVVFVGKYKIAIRRQADLQN